MSYNFEQAVYRAIEVLRDDFKQARKQYEEDPDNLVKIERYLTYKNIIDKLDALI